MYTRNTFFTVTADSSFGLTCFLSQMAERNELQDDVEQVVQKALRYQQPNNNLYQPLVFKIHQREEEMQTAQ